MKETTQQRIERIAEEYMKRLCGHYDERTRAHLVAALTAFAEEEADKWYDIEIAPKDGTIIRGYWKNYDHQYITCFREGKWIYPLDGKPFAEPPLFWQPLPEAPKQD